MVRTAPNATIAVTNVSCNGGADGQIAVSSGTGGTGTGYQTSIDDVTYHNLPKTFFSLSSGSQTIYVKDSNGCKQSYAQTVTQPTAQTCTISVSAFDDGTNIGQITASLGGGTGVKTVRLYLDTSAPYSDYSTDTLVATATGVSNGGTHTFTGLSCGATRYWVQVTDALSCVVNSTTSVNVCSFILTNRVKFNTTAATASGGSTINPIYLRYDDYVNYVANGSEYGNVGISTGYILYRDNSGLTWNQGAGYIFDYLGSNCAFQISSSGVLLSSGTNCT